MSVMVVPVIDAVLVRPGVIVPALLSTQEACTSNAPAVPGVTCILSEVEVSKIITIDRGYRVSALYCAGVSWL